MSEKCPRCDSPLQQLNQGVEKQFECKTILSANGRIRYRSSNCADLERVMWESRVAEHKALVKASLQFFHDIGKLLAPPGESKSFTDDDVLEWAKELTAQIAALTQRAEQAEAWQNRAINSAKQIATVECIDGVWWAKCRHGGLYGPQATEREAWLEVAEMRLAAAEAREKRLREGIEAAVDEKRILEWQLSTPRQDPALEFTAGSERTVATLIEIERIAGDNRLTAALRKGAAIARAHEPNNGWGTRTRTSDAWADGFRTACVEISDKFTLLAQPSDGKEAEGGK
jgi:hypothetical protein